MYYDNQLTWHARTLQEQQHTTTLLYYYDSTPCRLVAKPYWLASSSTTTCAKPLVFRAAGARWSRGQQWRALGWRTRLLEPLRMRWGGGRTEDGGAESGWRRKSRRWRKIWSGREWSCCCWWWCWWHMRIMPPSAAAAVTVSAFSFNTLLLLLRFLLTAFTLPLCVCKRSITTTMPLLLSVNGYLKQWIWDPRGPSWPNETLWNLNNSNFAV